MLVQKAYAQILELLTKAQPSKEIIALKGLETLSKVGDGKSTKIIIPSEIQSLAGLATSLKEIIN